MTPCFETLGRMLHPEPWIDAQTAQAICNDFDTFALSQFDGFPPQPVDLDAASHPPEE